MAIAENTPTNQQGTCATPAAVAAGTSTSNDCVAPASMMMKQYTLRTTGDALPAIGLGTWKASPEQVKTAVQEAVRLGYRVIDCAAIYGNEKDIGHALQELFQQGVVQRKDLFITSKLWNSNHKAKHVIPALKQTLADLQLDYLDLYLIHWPVVLKHGVGFPSSAEDMLSLEDVPTVETWRELEKAVDQGLVRNIGVSNYSIKKLKALLDTARIPPAVNQVECHPYLQQNALREFCKQNNVHVTCYSSLGSTDRPDRLKQEDDPILLEDPTIAEIAKQKGVSTAAILLKWAIMEGCSVIPKSVRPKRLQQNLAVDQTVKLNEQDMQKIRALDRHRRYVNGLFWCIEGSAYTAANLWDE